MKLPEIKPSQRQINKLKNHMGFFGLVGSTIFFLLVFPGLIVFWQERNDLVAHVGTQQNRQINLEEQLHQTKLELEAMQSEDQYLRNEKLQSQIKAIEETYQKSVSAYEKILELKDKTDQTEEIDKQFAQTLSLLADKNYASASAVLIQLNKLIGEKETEIAAKYEIPTNVVQENSPPASGFRQQRVATDLGSFLVSIVSADLNSARVVVDTAAQSDCANDCPVESLANFAARNGAFAGINGSYFCPASYPSCADKKNSFDTLLMNKNKVYFNSDNNVYSTVPAVAFYDNTARFMAQSLEWGRDTGVDAVIANQPLLVQNGQLVFTGGGEPKEGARGGRSFIGGSDSTVYIGVVHNATVAESAKVLHTLGLQNALNLDNGGSTALWYSGYKVGPGRNLANAILLVRK